MKRMIAGAMMTGAVLGALVGGSAMAADMAVKAPLMKAPPPAFSWSGCYINAGVGYGLFNQDHSTTFASGIQSIEITDGGRGWLGRFGGGCDYQLSGTVFSNFVIGVLGDYDVMDLKGTLVPETVNLAGAVVSGDAKESAAWAVGGRIGYVVAPMVLSYVDGGWAQTRFDQVNFEGALGVATGTAAPQHTYSGWFLGGGFEYNFNWLPIPGLFLRTEYRYASYQRDDLASFFTATGAPTGNIIHSQPVVQTATTSLVWRFNWFH